MMAEDDRQLAVVRDLNVRPELAFKAPDRAG